MIFAKLMSFCKFEWVELIFQIITVIKCSYLLYNYLLLLLVVVVTKWNGKHMNHLDLSLYYTYILLLLHYLIIITIYNCCCCCFL